MANTKKTSEDERYMTPAARIAKENGKETFPIIISRSYPGEETRYVHVCNNPPANIPVEEEVLVDGEEYVALINSKRLSKQNERLMRALAKNYAEKGTL